MHTPTITVKVEVFTGTLDIGLYTKKKQHKQQHKFEAKLVGPQLEDIYSKQRKLYWLL
jgi:hypothetical protein